MKRSLLLLAAGVLVADSAWAMCGCMFVPTPSGTEVLDPGIYNSGSEVVVLRQGNQTTLTLSNDFFGDFSEFAIVMPVPEGIEAENVSKIEPAPIQELRSVTAPRLNRWKCSDFNRGRGCNGGFGMSMEFSVMESNDGGTPAPAPDSSAVDVEAEFSVGEFDIRVLSSESSGGLLDWLDEEGLGVPSSADSVLQSYIDSGSRFMVANVNLGAIPEGQEWLSPLQITYQSDVMMVPIRLGAINSTGVQHVFFNVFTSINEGRVGISNYPEMKLDAGCMLKADETLETAYVDQIDAALENSEGAVWLPEYTGWWYGDMSWAGFVFDEDSWSEHFYTRLHLAITPEAATQDVVLYPMNNQTLAYQTTSFGGQGAGIEFVEFNSRLWDRYRFCGEDEILTDLALPTCGDAGLMTRGCSAVDGVGGASVAGLVLLAMARRRRPS